MQNTASMGAFAKRDAMSFGTTSRIEASDAPVMVQLSSVSHSASPWRKSSCFLAAISSRAGSGSPVSAASSGQNRFSRMAVVKWPSPGFWGLGHVPKIAAPGCGHRTPVQSS